MHEYTNLLGRHPLPPPSKKKKKKESIIKLIFADLFARSPVRYIDTGGKRERWRGREGEGGREKRKAEKK